MKANNSGKKKLDNMQIMFAAAAGKNVTFFSDDNGHAYHKWAVLTESGIRCGKIPSVVGDDDSVLTDLSGRLVDTYKVDGKQFVCSVEVKRPLNLKADSYQWSPENKALVAHCTKLAGVFGKRLILSTSLPLKMFFSGDGGVNKPLTAKIRKLFIETKTTNASTDEEFSVLKSKTFPEGFAAYYDWAITDDGYTNPLIENMTGPVAVIDIGGKTTDIVTILAASDTVSIDFSRSETIQKGVLDCIAKTKSVILNRLQADTREELSETTNIAYRILDQAFSGEVIKLSGYGELDVRAEIFEIKEEFVKNLHEQIKRVIGNVFDYQMILFSGGGSVTCKKELAAAIPGSEFTSEFSNAKGMLKLMTMLEGHKLLGEVANG